MAGTPTSHAYFGSDLRVMIGSAWRRQRRDECSKTSLVGGEQTNNSHILHTVLQTHSSFVGVGSVSLPAWHPHSSPDDASPLLIPQGALAPARSVIINRGEARGHRSVPKVAQGTSPRTPVASHLCVGGGGAELVGSRSLQKTSAPRAVKDPGGTVLKAKK